MKREIKSAWVAALRGGEYKQGRGRLHPDDDTFCCLGVLCELHRKQFDGEWVECKTGGNDYFSMHDVIPDQVVQWSGVPSVNPSVVYNDDRISLATLNDSRELPFSELADIIESQL